MNLPKNYQLKPWQRDDPVLWREALLLSPEYMVSPDQAMKMIAEILGVGKSMRLQTWKRDAAAPDGPHWIGVTNGTPLHVDPRYPRYTHQIVSFNDGWGLTGFARRIGDPLCTGTLFCCDTHSPHQLIPDHRQGEGRHYLAASMDCQEPLPAGMVKAMLLSFLKSEVLRLAGQGIPMKEDPA